MTSSKKPLIAVAVALATVFGTMTAIPANAAVATGLTVNAVATTTDGLTEANAVVLPVPADNAVQATDALKIALTGLDNNATITATATNAFIVSTVGDSVTASAGAASASVATGTGTSANFYVYTKSTTVGKVVIANGATTIGTYYVKGTAGALNTISVSSPTAALGTTAKIVVTGTDVFGNPVAGSTVAIQVVSATATNTYSVTADARGLSTKELTGLEVGSYDVIATATVASAVTGLTAPTGFVRGTLKVVDLAALVASKDADLLVANGKLADATAKLADATTKLADASANYAALVAKYNALVAKWNKAHPKSKVALLK